MACIDISALCALAGQAVADLVEAVDAGACPTVSRKATFGQIVDVITGDVNVSSCAISSIATNRITTGMIQNGQITVGKMAVNSVNSDQYVDGSIDTIHIADSQITVGKMAANSVDSDQYVDASIDVAHMSANSIDSNQYVDGSIDTAHIADDQVTLGKMATGTDGNLITYDACTNPAFVVTGTCGQVLTSNGAGAAPTFQAAAGGSGSIFAKVVKTTDETVNNSITLQDDDVLKFTPTVCKTYTVFLMGVYCATSVADMKVALSVPACAAALRLEGNWAPSGSGNALAWTTSDQWNAGGAIRMNANWGRVVMSCTAGDVNVQWAQQAAEVSDTKMLKGSMIVVYEEG